MKSLNSSTIGGCLEDGVWGKQVQLGTFEPIRDKVFWKEQNTVIHWGFFPVGGKIEPWVIAPNVMSVSGYVSQNIMNKERFHLWDCPEDLWMKINKEHMVSMCIYLSATPPSGVL